MAINVIQSAGIALINNGKIFLIKPYSSIDKWGIPKGHLNEGEDIQKTAIREFTEETGIKVVGALKYFLTVSTRYNDTIKNVNVYKCVGTGTERFISSNIITDGIDAGHPENVAGEWFLYNEAIEKIHAYQIPIIKKLKSEDNTFKLFHNNRDVNIATNELVFNKTVSLLIYDNNMDYNKHIYMLQKYLNISDKVIFFIDQNNYEIFNKLVLEYYKNKIPENLLFIVISKDKIYINDIVEYVNKNIKMVNIIIGSDKEQKCYKKLYDLYSYLSNIRGINVLELTKYTV